MKTLKFFSIFLSAIAFGSLSTKAQGNYLNTNTATNWNELTQSGFYQATNATTSPGTSDWYWGVNIGHSVNATTNSHYNGQLLLERGTSHLYFRSTNSDGTGQWFKAIRNAGDQSINGSLSLSGDITAKSLQLTSPGVARTTNWDNIWKSGFYESTDCSSAPTSSGWYWGVNLGHSYNREGYGFGGQILISNSNLSSTMYFRCKDQNGVGIWKKVLHDNGDQQINGNLTVGGKVNAREILVEVNAGADYVFKADYGLKNLSEVESFVKENGHLPGIPSEAEMQKNGLNMNEFQIQLLQKIEELTLYVIQQQKEIEALKKELKY